MRWVAAVALALTALMAPAPAQSDPRGNPSDWSYLNGPDEAKWDPCAPITWSTPADGSNLDVAFTRAIRKLGWLTGYTFVRVPGGGQITEESVPSDEPTLVSLNAVAYTALHMTADHNGVIWMTSAEVVMDEVYTATYPPKESRQLFRSAVLPFMMHELGHVMGLGHAHGAGRHEVMKAGAVNQPMRYGLGDRAGLAAIHAGSCAAWPPPSTEAPATPDSGASDRATLRRIVR